MEITVEDIDGNIYESVRIGSQIWMANNLKTTKCNDGSEIPFIILNSNWDNANGPGYCWYNNNENTFGQKYGALYNWYVIQSCDVCPDGWRVPTEADWMELEEYLGGADVAGGKMKQVGEDNWNSPNLGATDEFGFTALPTGYREPNLGQFREEGEAGGWWSGETKDQENAYLRYLRFDTAALISSYGHYQYGNSIRCIKE
jgi:uncharacterized protein (TIGR02145 family)